MLRPSQWLRVFAQLIPETAQTLEVVLLGGPGDRATADRIQKACESALPHVKWFNACDGRSLVDSLRLLASCSTLITVDSALGHYARFIKIPVRSLWGPTDPSTRIHPDFGEQKHTYYHRLPCSPCIHLAGALPCGGNNLCIEAAVALVEGKIPSDEAPGLLPISAQGNSSTAREKHPLVGAGS
jgi:ADP-heptose:LPS heptosyltransferase